MSKHFVENKKDLCYYLTLYTLEGHTTWRAHLSSKKGAFEIEQKNWALGGKAPKVTQAVVMRIDRLTGTFTPQ